MNRIIIIGNGFDLAHKLQTRYSDFINHFWSKFYGDIFSREYLESCEFNEGDNLCASFHMANKGACVKKILTSQFKNSLPDGINLLELQSAIEFINKEQQKICQQRRNDCPGGSISCDLSIDNAFLKRISETSIENWVDIEEEYFEMLRGVLAEQDSKGKNRKVKILNEEFEIIKILLEKYLFTVTANAKIKKQQSITNAFSSPINIEDIDHSKQNIFLDSILTEMGRFNNSMEMIEEVKCDNSYSIYETDEEAYRHYVLEQLKNESFKKSYCSPNRTLILNFNYTKTAESLYLNEEMNYEVINIHGELNNINNPMIFGYGDEMDDDYKRLEKERNTCFLDNLKTIQYLNTGNYGKLRQFTQAGLYQVFIMGHSCGSSDRSLLQMIFEHTNCFSIKPYFYESEKGVNDYMEKVKRISKIFTDKQNWKDTLASKEKCSPLVPF